MIHCKKSRKDSWGPRRNGRYRILLNPARAGLALAVCFALLQSGARAEDVAATLTVAWESFWHQTGYLQAIQRWDGPVRVRFSGASVARHKDFAMRQLVEVFEAAGLPISEAAADDPAVNLEVEFVSASQPLPSSAPCITNRSWRNFVIQRAKVRANEQSLWRCMLHESMHVMGFAGHPMGNTVLTYFARSDRLTDIDRLLLKTIYSSDVEPGMSPFAVLSVFAGRLIAAAGADTRSDVRQEATSFLRRTVREMEAFGSGSGEGPTDVLRSGKATNAGLAQGRTDIQFFLGVAYLRGHIVEPDKQKALDWLAKAAAASHVGAQRLLKRLSEEQSG